MNGSTFDGSDFERGISRERAAAELGVGSSTVSERVTKARTLEHPEAYAKSYKGQKIAEALEGDVDALWIGHYHNQASFKHRHIHVEQLPCFQSQYAWLARKALHPDIGGLIIDMWLADDGTIARWRRELVSFDVIEEDWDHEASRRAGRGWSVGEATLPE